MAKISININTGTIQQEEYILGIDLGTTNSLIALVHGETKKPFVLSEFDNTKIIPSVVYIDKKEIIVGEQAKNKLEQEPKNTIYSVKNLIGKSFQEIKDLKLKIPYEINENKTNNQVEIKIENETYSPIQISAFILLELKKRAEHILKTSISKAIVTVPAYFNDAQRQATKDAGKLVDLEIVRIINEPTAASLAYGIGLNKEESKIIAVYDFGGGTFDISILKISNGIFDVLATNGNTNLGGDDIDKEIVNFWMNKNQALKSYENKPEYVQQIRLLAEKAKISLTNEPFFTSNIGEVSLSITKEEFEQLIKPLIQKTLTCFTNALSDAELSKTDIQETLMVGGTTKSPYIKKCVSEFIGKQINDSLNPDEAVALGAAVQADMLQQKSNEFLLLDITPLSLGVETIGGLMDVLIPKNSKIPTKIGRQYSTQKDGQTGIVVSVYQGERDLVKNNKKLGEFILKGIPNMPAGFPKIEIQFTINADGILNVKAKELRSGIEQSIEIKAGKETSDSEIEQMLESSLTNAQNDANERALIEAMNEATQMIETTEKFVQKNKTYLHQNELDQTQKGIGELKTSLQINDKITIQEKTEILNKITQPFSERIMDIIIAEAMKGKKIN